MAPGRDPGLGLARWQADHVVALLQKADPGSRSRRRRRDQRRPPARRPHLGAGRQGRVRQGGPGRGARRPGRPRGPLGQGPALATPDGLVIGAVPERADVRDALVGRDARRPARGALVATGSLRRRAQLAHCAPTCASRACGATSPPGSTGRRATASTPWSWPPPPSTGSGWGRPHRRAARPDGDAAPGGAGRAGGRVPRRRRRRARPAGRIEHAPARGASTPSGGSWPSWAATARCRPRPTPRLAGDSLARGCVASRRRTSCATSCPAPPPLGAGPAPAGARHLAGACSTTRAGAGLPLDRARVTVYLVGAGPGDPGLLTVRAPRCCAGPTSCVRPAVAGVAARPGARRRRADRRRQGARATSDWPRRRSTTCWSSGARGRDRGAAQGRRPVRVRPRGRGGRRLAEAGVPFEVVPGITSAIAVPAYAGIPVTLRHSSTSVTIVTGHEERRRGRGRHRRLAGGRPGGRHHRDPHGGGPHRAHRRGADGRRAVARHAGGRRPVGHPPRAAHRAGHAGHHRRRRWARRRRSWSARSPPDLAWFENRPLFGRRVVVTRAREQASERWPGCGPGRGHGRGARHRDRRPGRRRRRAGGGGGPRSAPTTGSC